MSTNTRGFASPRYDKDRQREVARKGGQAAHVKGTAHEWTPEEAQAAGRKGGAASAAARRAKQQLADEGAA